MLDSLVAAVNALPLTGLLLAVSAGYAVSRIQVGGITLGPAGATLFVSLLLGHLGVRVASAPGMAAGGVSLGTLGFALFVYSVGFDAAPHFFSAFRERRGFGFVAIAITVNVLAVAAALAMSRVFELGPGATAGLLAGALTSAPTFAAASEVLPDATTLSVAFALTYPFGLVGIVLLIQVIPRLRGQDLARAVIGDGELPSHPRAQAAELTRSFEVQEEDIAGHSLAELDLTHATGCVISRVRRGTDAWIPTGDTQLEPGDVVTAVGRLDELRKLERLVGPETAEPSLTGSGLVSRRVEVRRSDVIGRSLDELRIIHRYHCVVTAIERGRHGIEPDAQVVLARGDVVEVLGRREDVRTAAASLGRFEPRLEETDIAAYAGGLVLGLALGAVRIPAFGLELGLGTAGGLLVVGLGLGWRQRLGPVRTHVPRAARQLMRDFGILLFVGETGLHAGAGLEETLRTAAWQTLAAGVVVNAVALLGALVVARRVLRLRPIEAWGSVAGGLTSSAALETVRRVSDSNEAAISYAAAYAMGSVLATLAGPLIVMLVR